MYYVIDNFNCILKHLLFETLRRRSGILIGPIFSINPIVSIGLIIPVTSIGSVDSNSVTSITPIGSKLVVILIVF